MNNDLAIQLDNSIALIKSYHFLKIGKFVIGGLRNGRIQVNSYLYYNSINEVPKETIKTELKTAKDCFLIIKNESSKFKEFAINSGIDYHLVLDTGNAGISICAEIEGVYKEFI